MDSCYDYHLLNTLLPVLWVIVVLFKQHIEERGWKEERGRKKEKGRKGEIRKTEQSWRGKNRNRKRKHK